MRPYAEKGPDRAVPAPPARPGGPVRLRAAAPPPPHLPRHPGERCLRPAAGAVPGGVLGAVRRGGVRRPRSEVLPPHRAGPGQIRRPAGAVGGPAGRAGGAGRGVTKRDRPKIGPVLFCCLGKEVTPPGYKHRPPPCVPGQAKRIGRTSQIRAPPYSSRTYLTYAHSPPLSPTGWHT